MKRSQKGRGGTCSAAVANAVVLGWWGKERAERPPGLLHAWVMFEVYTRCRFQKGLSLRWSKLYLRITNRCSIWWSIWHGNIYMCII